MNAATFGKAEHLKSRKQIEALFAEGRSLVHHPVRLKYRLLPRAEGAVPVQAGVSASRKAFKRAVDRNRIKRVLREAYRLQKQTLVPKVAATNQQVVLFLIYTAKQALPFDVIYKATGQCLNGLQQQLATPHENTH